MKRIVLIGAESTGKSTLAQALARHYNEPCTDEFVRHYVEQLPRELEAQDLEPIAKGQFAIEDAGLEHAQRLVIHDTNILSSIIYGNYYFDTEIEWVNEQFLEREYALYLLCMPDIPWEADEGQRESPEARDALHELFRDSLDILQIPYLAIHGSKEARMQQAVQAIDAELSADQ
jgi:NadR type nicotinamide-nucleotide adenylyltransferase